MPITVPEIRQKEPSISATRQEIGAKKPWPIDCIWIYLAACVKSFSSDLSLDPSCQRVSYAQPVRESAVL